MKINIDPTYCSATPEATTPGPQSIEAYEASHTLDQEGFITLYATLVKNHQNPHNPQDIT